MRLFWSTLLLMLVAGTVPTLMVGLIAVHHTQELLVRDAQELAQQRVAQLRIKTQVALAEPTAAVLQLAQLPGFFALPVQAQRSHLAAVLNQQRALVALTVFGKDQKRKVGLQALAVRDFSSSELQSHEARAQALLPLLNAETGVRSKPSWNLERNHPTVTLAVPMGEGAQTTGYLAAEVSLSSVEDTLRAERVGSSGFVYLVDAAGAVIAGRGQLGQADAFGSDTSARPVVRHLLRTLSEMPGQEALHVGSFGEGAAQIVGAYAVIPQLGWTVVSEQPLHLAYAGVSRMKRRVVLAEIGAVIVALVLAFAFSRSLTLPLRGFIQGALELAKGHFGTEVKVSAKNELGDLASTFNYMSQQLSAFHQETGRLYETLEGGYLETIVALANSIDSKDSYTRGHSQRVGDLAVEIGRELGLTPRELKTLHYGGILHDIGKIGIVDAILCKQSRLTDDEMQVMRQHPEIGDSIISAVSFLSGVRSAVRNHHERFDGQGYPDKLAGEAIPLIARIVNCADTFDACTSTRPYQKAMPLPQAWGVMESLSGKQVDPKVLAALRRVIENKGVRLEGSSAPVKLAG